MRVIQCPEAASRGEDQAPHRPREALFLTTLMVLHVSSSSGIVIVLMKNTGSILAGYHFYKWANESISSIRTIRIAPMLTQLVEQCRYTTFFPWLGESAWRTPRSAPPPTFCFLREGQKNALRIRNCINKNISKDLLGHFVYVLKQ